MAANNRQFQEFMDRFDADSVSTKVRSLMWECWIAATEAAEAGKSTRNSAEEKCSTCIGKDICGPCVTPKMDVCIKFRKNAEALKPSHNSAAECCRT